MPAQEEAIKKGRLALREVEIVHDFGGHELWHRGHRENAVYPKAAPRQVELPFSCRFPGNSPFPGYTWPVFQVPAVQQSGCQAVLTALGCLYAWESYIARSKGRWRDAVSVAFCGLVFSADCVRSRLTRRASGVSSRTSMACGFRTFGE